MSRLGLRREGWLALASIFLACRALGVPLPPPPPAVFEKAIRIATPPANRDLAAYAPLFATDMRAYLNGSLVAHGRDEWLKFVADPKAPRAQVIRFATGNPIIAVEEVTNIGNPVAGGGAQTLHDCCTWARTASYHLDANGDVDEVRLADAQSDWMQPPSNPPR